MYYRLQCMKFVLLEHQGPGGLYCEGGRHSWAVFAVLPPSERSCVPLNPICAKGAARALRRTGCAATVSASIQKRHWPCCRSSFAVTFGNVRSVSRRNANASWALMVHNTRSRVSRHTERAAQRINALLVVVCGGEQESAIAESTNGEIFGGRGPGTLLSSKLNVLYSLWFALHSSTTTIV